MFSVRYKENQIPKMAYIMIDDDYDMSEFNLGNFEKFKNYTNGYLSLEFNNDFLTIIKKENNKELCKVYCPKKMQKQISSDISKLGYFSLRYRKHFIEKYNKRKE